MKESVYEYIISYNFRDGNGSAYMKTYKPINSNKTKRAAEEYIERTYNIKNVGIVAVTLARKTVKKRKFIK